MGRFLAGVLLLGTLVACADRGPGPGSPEALSQALCADLASSINMVSLSKSAKVTYGEEEAPGHIAVAVQEECPEQAESNTGLRAYLTAHGINPDDL